MLWVGLMPWAVEKRGILADEGDEGAERGGWMGRTKGGVMMRRECSRWPRPQASRLEWRARPVGDSMSDASWRLKAMGISCLDGSVVRASGVRLVADPNPSGRLRAVNCCRRVCAGPARRPQRQEELPRGWQVLRDEDVQVPATSADFDRARLLDCDSHSARHGAKPEAGESP